MKRISGEFSFILEDSYLDGIELKGINIIV